MAGDPITVVLVEDNDVFRESLELLLGTVPDLHVAAAVEIEVVDRPSAVSAQHARRVGIVDEDRST